MLRLSFLHGNFPPTQQTSLLSQYQPFSLPTTQLSTKAIPKSTTNPSTTQLMLNTTFSTNLNTNEGRNFVAKKPIEFTLIPVSYDDLLPYLLDSSMVAITSAKVPQTPFFRGYDSNTTCACHGEASRHSIEHYMTSKRKVQSLIDAGWLKFKENRL